MCGIAGYLSRKQPPSLEDGYAMLAAIDHRGPDESGIYRDSRALLGNVRLSIVDLITGQQPIQSENGRFWIVYNGEIYNHEELRRRLIDRHQCRFHTNSDTEVIVNLFQHHGKSCLKDLDGQFAFAIWDTKSKDLFLARDRLGICPLYYYEDAGHFAFGSEVKALFALSFVPRTFRWDSLLDVGAFWATIPPETHFEGINELSPGECLTVGIDHTPAQREIYWSLPNPESQIHSTAFAVEETRTLLDESVKRRLKADVEVGTYMSGGLDSSIISILAGRFSAKPIKTFSIAFEEKRFDERSYQEQLARKLGTDHHTILLSGKAIQKNFLKSLWHAEKVLFRTAPVPMMLLSEKVRESGLKVVLTGEGADEVFFGYDIFKEAKLIDFLRRNPDSHLRPLMIKKLYPYLPQFDARYFDFQKMFYRRLVIEPTPFPFASHRSRWEASRSLFQYLTGPLTDHSRIEQHLETRRFLVPCDGLPILRQAQHLEMKSLLSGYLLSAQGDRMTMANGVEGRHPFLSHLLIERMATVKDSLKISGFREKRLLKKAFGDLLPAEILRRPKQPYLAPDARSFSTDCDYISDFFSEKNLKRYDFISAPRALQLVKKCLGDNEAPLSFKDNFCFMSLLSVLALHRLFIEETPRGYSAPAPKNLKVIDVLSL